ncbi:MAG: RNA polymerase sigma factor SigZ [bacterium]|nr:RNA polymerase sigma factor SigZ [bacterium]
MDEFVNQLWKEFHKALLNFIKKNISNPEDAEDILQNVFLKIYAGIHLLKEKEKVTSWLYQITRNTIIDSYRAKGKNEVTELMQMDGIVGAEDPVYEKAREREIAGCLSELVEELPEKYRNVMKLYEFESFTHKEIAHRLGISVSASKTRVQRSREKLQESLKCCCRSRVESKNKRSASHSNCSYLQKRGRNELCTKALPG